MQIKQEELLIRDAIGEVVSYLNPHLVRTQGISSEALEALRFSHAIRLQLFKLARSAENAQTLRMLAKLFDDLEFEQQKLWGFDPNPNFHRFFDLPGCTCPKEANERRIGQPGMRGPTGPIYSPRCIIHGAGDRGLGAANTVKGSH